MVGVEQIEVVFKKLGKQGSLQSLLAGKGLVVEFVGPTGSGKTTNCIHLSRVLKRENVNVLLFSDVKKRFHALPFYHKVRIVISVLSNKTLFQYVFLLMKHRIFSADSLSRYIRLCVFNAVLEQARLKEKPDIILLDQWTIQGLWSATIFKSDKHQPLPSEMKKFFFKVDFVIYFDVDVTTANDRIKTRNFGDSRFDKMEGTKRLNALRKYTHYLFELYEQSDCKNKRMFSAYESPEKNAAEFLLFLKKELTKKQH